MQAQACNHDPQAFCSAGAGIVAFYSAVAFDITTFNLHSFFTGVPTLTTRGGGMQPFHAATQTVLGFSLTTPEQSFTWTSAFTAAFSAAHIVATVGEDVTYDAQGYVLDGCVTGLVTGTAGKVTMGLFGMNIAAADIRAAEQSLSSADDRALFASALRGNDMIALNLSNDRIDTGNGKDLIVNDGGRDTLAAGAGDDMVLGGSGVDIVNGGRDDDILIGNFGNDRLLGSTGQDMLVGGRGNDILTSGDGSDQFVFSKGDGDNLILDFDPITDRIVLTGNGDLAIRQIGADVRLSFADVTILLKDFDKSHIRAGFALSGGHNYVGHVLDHFMSGWTYLA